MQRSRILSTGPIERISLDILKPFGEITVAPDNSEAALVQSLEAVVGLIVRGSVTISSRVIEAGADLKVIARSGVGYDTVDIDAATARGLPVVFTPGAGARAVAEGAMAMMLSLCKRISYWDDQLKAGNWESRFQGGTGDLEGGVLGIVGFGRIGQILAQLAVPFEMEVLAFDPYVAEKTAGALDVELVELNELLARASFISLHAAATHETRGMISRARLRRVRRGAFLINMARGELVESLDVLYEALEERRLGGVGLDVFSPEPPDVSHPIFRSPNCITSPHALGMSARATERIFTSMAQDMAAIFRGDRPRFVVNPEVLS